MPNAAVAHFCFLASQIASMHVCKFGAEARLQHLHECCALPDRMPSCLCVSVRGNSTTGIPCQAYHAGRPARERSQVLEDWNEGRLPVVAATIAFGMGIDRASKYCRSLLY